MVPLKIKLIDTGAGIAIADSIGIRDVVNLGIAGDYVGVVNAIFDNFKGMFLSNGFGLFIQILVKRAVLKWIANVVPGSGATFNIFGLVELEL